ncbi:T7SS effector LXG polymorphic toxin, partial [Schleiferilactobacillus perolens]|uniref:T7SS effector LXG polymorphic toxin n=1 Tax=Schleiferilactobacillus perolens TaxID=100468 RepID=UPI000B0B6117
MAKRLDYAELMAYRRSMLNGLSDRQERLARVRRNLTTLINGGSLKGAAAKASNQYLQEVYLQGLLKSFDETIENLRQVLAQYVGGYTSVDPSPDFYLSDEEYDNLNDKIKSQFHKADRVLDGLVSAGNKVS